MPVRLRGHHFLCILTYRGLGYTPAFVENMTAVVDQIGRGRPVVPVDGPDDICDGLTPECRKACYHDCSKPSTAEMDLLATEAVRQLIPFSPGVARVLDREQVALLREAFAEGSIREACESCSWNDLCSGIAGGGFTGTRLFGPP